VEQTAKPRLRVLVTYGSERGATAEIAQAIAETLLNARFDVDIANAREVKHLDGYDAVVIGGALYLGRWHRDARKFVKRHANALRARTVYMFSSGPLDGSASDGTIPPTPSVAKLVQAIGARAHVTFGGKLARDAEGFITSRMAKKLSGDWRSWHQIRAWAGEIAAALETAPAHVAVTATEPADVPLAVACFLIGVMSLAAGATLVTLPDGMLLGLVVFVVFGLGSIVSAAQLRHSRPLLVP
jgi:menaquinone-dependent protoporphyrinogen oxidase